MSRELKRSERYQHVYVIVRYELGGDEKAPIDLRVTVKKVVTDPHYADAEVKGLNDLNRHKNSYYFSQVTRFEEIPVEVQTVTAPTSLTASRS